MARLKSAEFDERMTLVEHLDELRTRIIFCLIAIGVAFAFCFWQDDLMLDLANSALPDDTQPITLSPTEPFFTTVTVAAYGALILTLPLLLYQVYAFVLPAFSPHEKKVLMPFLIAIPLLFVGGVAFAYFVVLPVAIKFLLNFNEANFNIEVQAGKYYSFLGLMLLSMGLLFQIPIAILSLTRLEIVDPEWFARNRRYAIFIIAVVSAAAPGGDPISMLLIMVPLLLLYEASVVLARRFGRPRGEEAADSAVGAAGSAAPGTR